MFIDIHLLKNKYMFIDILFSNKFENQKIGEIEVNGVTQVKFLPKLPG
jgi:hypothetical protein